MKIVVLDSAGTAGTDLSFDRFHQLGDLTVYPHTEAADLITRIGDAEVVINNKCFLTKEVLSACPNLCYIGLLSTGYNTVDIDYCKSRGIPVCNVPAYSTSAVAQQVFAYLLTIANKINLHDARVKKGDWVNCTTFCFYEAGLFELRDLTIGLFGFGDIAKQVARLAHAFEMKVLVHTRTVRPCDQAAFDFVKFVAFDELLTSSDVVSIHTPLNAETTGRFDRTALSLMKSSAILINTARGGIVEEAAAATALQEEKLFYFCTDVLSTEPPMPDNPILFAPRTIVTPHTAWAPTQTRRRLLDVVYAQLKSFQEGEVCNNVAT